MEFPMTYFSLHDLLRSQSLMLGEVEADAVCKSQEEWRWTMSDKAMLPKYANALNLLLDGGRIKVDQQSVSLTKGGVALLEKWNSESGWPHLGREH